VGEHAQRSVGAQPQHLVGRVGGAQSVHPGVLGQQFLGRGEHGVRTGGQRRQCPSHTPGQVYRGGSGRRDPLSLQRRLLGIAGMCVGSQRHPEGARDAERWRTPNGKGLDRVDEIVDCRHPQPAQLARQRALIDSQQHAVGPGYRAFGRRFRSRPS